MILGIDEVGRGPWAGPLVVGAVVLGDGCQIDGLTDSKKLSAKRRQLLAGQIHSEAAGVGLGWVQADELDKLGLAKALRLATIRAVEAVKASYHEIIIDGTINFLQDTTKGGYVTTLAKADLLIPAVSAASIVAKVARDDYMARQSANYPEYGFDSHVGYGTAAHRAALEQYGVTPLHRRSFSPIAKLVADSTDKLVKTDSSHPSGRSTKVIGDEAETFVAEYLSANGYKVMVRNWRTKYCEIDIVAEKGDTRYFVEVKARRSASHGSGREAVTTEKQRKMTLAAEMYNKKYPFSGNVRLMVADVALVKSKSESTSKSKSGPTSKSGSEFESKPELLGLIELG